MEDRLAGHDVGSAVAKSLEAYFARPASNFTSCVRRIVRDELQHLLLHPTRAADPNVGDALALPVDHERLGATATPIATPGHNTPPSSSSTAAARRRNLEPRFAAVAGAPFNSLTLPSVPVPGGILKAECRSDADADDDYDSLFCSVDIDSLVAEAKAGSADEAPVLPSPILPLSTRQYAHVSSSPSPSPAPFPSPVVAPPQLERQDDANGETSIVLGFSPPRIHTSSAFSPSNGALSFCPSRSATASIVAALPPPPSPPPRSSSPSPAVSPEPPLFQRMEEELGVDDEDDHGIGDDDGEDDDNTEEGEEETDDGKASNEDACSLLDQLFPENSQQKRKRAKQENWQRWLVGFHPPGVSVPILPPEILQYIAAFLQPHMASYDRFASVCRLWRTVATEGPEWRRRYEETFGGPLPNALLEEFETNQPTQAESDTSMATDDQTEAATTPRAPLNGWYLAFRRSHLQYRAIVKRTKPRTRTTKRRRGGGAAPVAVDGKNERHRSLLKWASTHGHKAIVREVIRTVGIKAQASSLSVEDYLLVDQNGWHSPLHEATENEHEEVVRILIEEGGFDVSTYRLRCRPILYACRVGSVSIAKLLIKYGALTDIKSVRSYDCSPLQEAAAKGNVELVELLLDNDCDPNQGAGKTSPLADAVLRNHVEVVRCLLRRGARPACCREAVLHLAARQGYADVVELLLMHGAAADRRVQMDPPYGRPITAMEAAESEDVRRVFRRFSTRARRRTRRSKRSRPDTRRPSTNGKDEVYDDAEQDEDDNEQGEFEAEEDPEDEDDRHDDEADELALMELRQSRHTRTHSKSDDEPETDTGEEEEEEHESGEDQATVEHESEDQDVKEGVRVMANKRINKRRRQRRPDTALLELENSLDPGVEEDEERQRACHSADDNEPDAEANAALPSAGPAKRRKTIISDSEDQGDDDDDHQPDRHNTTINDVPQEATEPDRAP